jgi:hypothetical protein
MAPRKIRMKGHGFVESKIPTRNEDLQDEDELSGFSLGVLGALSRRDPFGGGSK